ncbi:MAG: RICIN domain-containing protein, partial [Pyrinomonadaceae bacterium]|nr:RICIN domain-containing protein [Phycisphaerales bacterium]
RNPYGDGGQCAAKCTAADYPHTGDGYKSCNGYTTPVTVWRASSYRPEFNTSYRYKLINSQTKMALDVRSWSKDDGAVLQQWPYSGGTNQLFKIELVASSTWRLVSVHSGKVITGTSLTAGSTAKQYGYRDDNAYEWGVDDHNGHFKLANKASKHVLQVPSGNYAKGTATQTGIYGGTANQDWDIIAVP